MTTTAAPEVSVVDLLDVLGAEAGHAVIIEHDRYGRVGRECSAREPIRVWRSSAGRPRLAEPVRVVCSRPPAEGVHLVDEHGEVFSCIAAACTSAGDEVTVYPDYDTA